MTTHLLINPTSGSAKSQKLRKLAPSHWHIQSSTLSETKTYISERIQPGDTLLIAGGDGTIQRVLDLCHHAGKIKGYYFGIFPMGTGNDVARALALTKLSLKKLMKLYAHPPKYTAELPLWILNHQLFCNSVTIGHDAKIIDDIMRWREQLPRKRLLLLTLYFLSALRSIGYTLADQTKITEIPFKKAKSIILSNLPSYGGGSLIARHDDASMLSVFVIKNTWDLIKLTWSRVSKKPLPATCYVNTLTIEKNEADIQIDGEVATKGPAKIQFVGTASFISAFGL